MTEARCSALVLAGSLLFGGFCLFLLHARYHTPFPPLADSFGTPEAGLHEVGSVALGYRRLAADMAWIQTLQYYGTHEDYEDEKSEQAHESDAGSYPRFLDFCRHVVAIDPYFTYVYYYGGGVLGWNLNRLSEAEELLKEGIARNPHEWRLPQYLAGLAYQKNHDIANLTRFLEGIIQDPDAPLMMKSLLANLYKKQHEYAKAVHVWELLYLSGDPAYMHRAMVEIRNIQILRKTQGS